MREGPYDTICNSRQSSRFFAMGLDKYKARRHRFRIAERTLWLLAWLGGAFGAMAGMYTFRHKTRHRVFRYGLPLLAAAEFVVYWLWMR
ncbi:putative membrane protein [Geobacillus sp. PA-3]|nr:putative membrane protein [Geobacillus sp. PA-3]